MTKYLMMLIGLLVGVLLTEFVRRPALRRLAVLDAQAEEEAARFAEYDRQWQDKIAAMPFEQRMEHELWEAGMRLNNWMPDVSAWEDDDAEAD